MSAMSQRSAILLVAMLVLVALAEAAPSNRLRNQAPKAKQPVEEARAESLDSEATGEMAAVDPEFDALTGNPDGGESGAEAAANEPQEQQEEYAGPHSLGAAGSYGTAEMSSPGALGLAERLNEDSQGVAGVSNESDDESSAGSNAVATGASLDDSDEPTGSDSNIANAKVRITPSDMQTAAGHHHHSGGGHYAHGLLAMGAHTGKKGAFGWHSKHPVGGKGRR